MNILNLNNYTIREALIKSSEEMKMWLINTTNSEHIKVVDYNLV